MAGRSSSIDVFLKLRGQRQFSKELATSGAQLESLGVRGAKSIAAFAATGDKLKNFGRSWTRNVSLPMVAATALAGKAAVDWESSFAGVRKTVDATEKQYASLEKGIRGMSLHIPVAANELAGIAEAAGQLGIKRQAILGFTRVIADLGVATNLAGEEGASTLARFANITQMPQSQFQRLGSVIVALGNAGASTEKDIAAMGLRLAAAGTFAGMSEPNVLAIANALSSVGIEAEAGGTAMSKVIKTINSQVIGQGPALGEFAEIAGMGAAQFSKAWKRDAAGTLTGWIEGLGRLKDQGKDVAGTLSDLHVSLRGERVQDTLARAAGAGDLLRESLSLGSKSWRENNALTEEARKRYETVASKLKILKNKVIDAGVSLGKDLLPPLIQLVEFAGPKIGAMADAFGSLPGPVKATALGFLILTGPVASGLGYFASGVGRALIMVNRLAAAGTAMQGFSWAMQQGMGASGASAYAFRGAGIAAAAGVAKGFTLSLGPMLAAAGIGNIVMSATKGDWETAGVKAGGAIAGGIAGFMVGGPLGAMVGVGLGSIGGGLLSSLISDSDVNKLKAQTKHAADATKTYRKALEHLSGSKGRAERAERAHRNAVRDANHASRAQARILARSGANSLPAYRAALRLADANRQVAKTSRQAQKANELHGFALKLYRRESLHAVASEKQLIPTLRRRLAAVKRQMKTEGETTPLLRRTVKLQERLRGINDKLTKTYAEAEEKGGRPWAKRLQGLTALQAEYGKKGKVLSDRLGEQRRKLKELTDMGLEQTPMWQDLRREISRTADALERFTAASDAPSGPRSSPRTRGGAPPRRGGTPRRRGAGGGPKAGPSSIRVPRTQRAKPSTDGIDLRSAFGGNSRPIVVQSILDGKTIAESTAQVAEDEAAFA